MLTACYHHAMGNLQVKDIPAPVHDEIRRRAALKRLTVRDFVLQLIERELERPSWEEWLAEVAAGPPAAPDVDAVAAVESARRGRADQLRRARRP